MIHTLNLSKLGLDEGLPDSVHIVAHPSSGRYGCYCHEGVYGLACFSQATDAERFSKKFDSSDVRVEKRTFDEARDLAKGRPMPVVSLMLLDDWDRPRIHYVR